jgi:hypothetical protein
MIDSLGLTIRRNLGLISLPILDELKESRFWGKREKSTKTKGLEPWIHFKEKIDEKLLKS